MFGKKSQGNNTNGEKQFALIRLSRMRKKKKKLEKSKLIITPWNLHVKEYHPILWQLSLVTFLEPSLSALGKENYQGTWMPRMNISFPSLPCN